MSSQAEQPWSPHDIETTVKTYLSTMWSQAPFGQLNDPVVVLLCQPRSDICHRLVLAHFKHPIVVKLKTPATIMVGANARQSYYSTDDTRCSFDTLFIQGNHNSVI